MYLHVSSQKSALAVFPHNNGHSQFSDSPIRQLGLIPNLFVYFIIAKKSATFTISKGEWPLILSDEPNHRLHDVMYGNEILAIIFADIE